MHDAHEFLRNLALILCVAAVTTILFQKLRQPVVLGYLIAGLIIGPYVPVPLVADPALAQTLSELGVILLMFSLGLEFSLRKLLRVGPTAGIVGVIQCSGMIWLGYVAARLFGWSAYEGIFAGAIIAISSTTIIVKAFAEQGVRGPHADLVFGVLIVEDLIAILLMAVLTAVASGAGLSPSALAVTVGKLAGFLAGMIIVGLLVVPRVVRAIVAMRRPETTLVASIGICFGLALLAQSFGYSVALGAFLAGSLVSESGEGKQIEHLIEPVRDMFAAIFFVSVGMLIQPQLVAAHIGAVIAFTVLVVVGKLGFVAVAAVLSGQPVRDSVRAGMSLAQIGEFSFIIAAVGMSLGVIGDFLYPVAVAVSAITTLLTPWLIRGADPAASWLDRHLPRPLQTFVSLYGSWIARLRASVTERETSRERRLVRLLLLDVVLLGGILVGASSIASRAGSLLEKSFGLPITIGQIAVIVAAGAVATPFCVGAFRIARELASLLAARAFPASAGVDLAAAPRRALQATLQTVIFLLISVPLLAATQPFLPRGAGLVLLAALALLSWSFWRSTANLHSHVRAGSEVVLAALAKQSQAETHEVQTPVASLLPGLGDPVPVELEPGSPVVGKTLGEIDLRGRTGATVLAIQRPGGAEQLPSGSARLLAGDRIALVGTAQAVEAARAILVVAAEPIRDRQAAASGP